MNLLSRFFLTLLLASWGLNLFAAEEPARILRHLSIYEKRDAYSAWPAIARADNGDIVVLFTRTEEHMAPNGEILLSRSTDNGETWLPPAIVYDTVLDDRESGVTKLNDGRLLAHFRTVQFRPESYTSLPETAYPAETIDRWVEYVQQSEYEEARPLHRAWHSVSEDHGVTWSPTTPGRDSIHGGVHLQNGTLLVASYRDDQENVGVYASDTPQGDWARISEVVCPRPDRIRFGEPHILQLKSGRIVMMIRATAKPYDDSSPECKLWGTYSDDNGRTWAEPYETPLWGFPPHLIQLADGRVLCSYGYRRPPFGQRVCLSEDGVTWKLEDEIVIRDDAPNQDLGYPVSIELEPGKILTVYYQPNVPEGANPSTHPPLPNRKKPGILGTVWTLPGYRSSPPVVAELKDRRELFVDDFLIESLDGLSLRLHRPQREGPAFHFDKPWEGKFSAYATVIQDGPLYRMYYRGLPETGGEAEAVTCYAESSDGIHWTKPELGLHEIGGSRANNVVLADDTFSRTFSPFLDTRPGVPPERRFKAVAAVEEEGLVAFVSKDGIRWQRWGDGYLFTQGMFDSQNVAFWSESEQQYVCYFRTWTGERFSGFRTISRATSKDFRNWTDPVAMDFGDTPREHLYTNGTAPYFRAPHIYVALAKRFFPDKAALVDETARELVALERHRNSSSDSVFMSTRGGNRYDRTFMEAFIRPGESPADWVSRDNIPALGVVRGSARDMYLYRLSHYAQSTARLDRYSLRLDGFSSLHAPYEGGELLSKPFSFTGSALEINYQSSAAGALRFELQDIDGNPIPGFSAAECRPIFGDEIERVVAWQQGSDVSSLSGQALRLRVLMSDADLYSFRFR